MRTTDGRRRRRTHHAATARMLSGGLTASAALGIVAALAMGSRTAAQTGAHAVSAPPTPRGRAEPPRKIVRIVRRHLAPPAGVSAPTAAIPARTHPLPDRSSPARPTRVARRPAPAPAPTPVTRSNGSR